MKIKPICKSGGAEYSIKRKAIGVDVCLSCGDEVAKSKKHTIVPMHKSNYMVVTDLKLLKGINNKGGKHGI